MIVCVDTNVILDVITDDPIHANRSQELLGQARDSGSIVICEIVYAELVPHFDTREELDAALGVLGARVIGCGTDVAYLAGTRWAAYRKAGGTRERVLTDFVIGAHAAVHDHSFLTRDRGFYRTYFPELREFSPG